MVDILKQDMTYIWAVSGDITSPTNSKIEEGWAVEAVPRQWWNWMQNRADSNIAYMLQKGIPEWDATTEYLANKSFVQRSGVVYRALLTSTNQDPVSAPTYWAIAFATYTTALNALGSVTPAANTMPYFTNGTTAATTSLTAFARTILDDADAAAVRTTISAQALDATLTAIAGASTGANILHYFTGTDTVATTTLSAFGRTLIDDADATAARTTLGLGTGATATVTTSTTDSTTGRLLKVGDFGLGSGAIAQASTDFNTLNATGVYTVSTPVNAPTAGTQMLFVMGNPISNRTVQISQAVNTGGIYWRANDTGVWSAWREFYHTDNFDPATKQNADATLTALAGLATAADRLPYFTGVDTTSLATFTAFGRSLVDDADATAARTTLGLGTAATSTVTTTATDTTANRLLKVADFGVGATALSSTTFITNLNSQTLAAGTYAYTNTATGAPEANAGTLIVQPYSGTAMRQIAMSQSSLGTTKIFTRSVHGSGVFGVWAEIFTTDNVSAFAQTLLDDTTPGAARTTLGCGTAATGTLTTSTIDGNVGRVLKVGDFGAGVVLVGSDTNLDNYEQPGNYITPLSGVTPLPAGWVNTRNVLTVGGGTTSGYLWQQITGVGANQNRIATRVAVAGVWTTWREIYHQGNSVGPVSQSGGVPTGAIIEEGANANGTYTKFADGTLIMGMAYSSSLTMSLYADSIYFGSVTVTYPVPTVGTVYQGAVGQDQAQIGWAGFSPSTATTGAIRYFSKSTTVTSTNIRVVVYGRWF